MTDPAEAVEEESSGTLRQAVFIAVASLALAWSGFQGSEWGRERLEGSDEAAALQEDSAQLTAQAERLEQQDIVLYVQWLGAVEAGDAETADRLFSLFRPELQDYVTGAPTDEDGVPLEAPFKSEDYDPAGKRAEAARVEADRQEKADQARKASATLARYGGMGVLFAVALVVSGIAGRLDEPYGEGLRWVSRGLLLIGLIFLLFAPLGFSAP